MDYRTYEHDIMPEIKARWSPRAFDQDRPVPPDDLRAILEAAHFAPSDMNEQPWLFLVAQTPEQRATALEVLNSKNRAWAFRAPVLLFILSRQNFTEDQEENRWHLFDAGTAWGYLSLEAQRRGLITHAMGGFSVTKARDAFGIPEDISVIAAVAVGYHGDISDLSPSLLEREHPGEREALDDLIYRY
jgi:nitroreductase